MALVETEKPPRAQNLDEAETKDLGGYDRGLSKTAKSRCPQPRQLICDAKCLWRRSSFVAALDQAEVKQLRSNGHFSVNGTLIEMWASMKELPAQGWRGHAAGNSARGNWQQLRDRWGALHVIRVVASLADLFLLVAGAIYCWMNTCCAKVDSR
jgi:hypothetical protein